MHYQGLYPIYTANTSKITPPCAIGGVNYGNACKVEIPHCSVGTVGRRPQGPKAMTKQRFVIDKFCSNRSNVA